MPIAVKRNHSRSLPGLIYTVDTLTFTGNYTPGGVALNPSTIVGGLGSSPTSGSTVVEFSVQSPTGYIYALVGTGASAKLKIFSAPGTELGAVAFPDATVTAVLVFLQFS